MRFKQVNNIVGWLIFAIASFVYLSTIESTASLWDCGEFISTAYKLGVAHSPGAPLFMMMGRVFSLFAASPEHVALLINAMSGLMSAFTILFLFWTITHLAKKIVIKQFGILETEIDSSYLLGIMGAGIVGSLAYTFSDTFWFSAVEAEVYAASSMFTALVFWAIFKWENVANEAYSDRWLVFIFYMMGLSIGIHLLNLLTIPTLIIIYYFKRYTPTLKGGIIAFLIGTGILGFIQFGIIQYLPIIASKFDLAFVNSFGMPFHYGTITFIIILGISIFLLLRWAHKKQNYLLHVVTLCAAFLIIGYSSYVTVILRSSAGVPINMTNPDNIMSLIPYLQRDQYGSQPLVSGPDFDARLIDTKEGRALYAGIKKDGKDFYYKTDNKLSYVFDKNRVFPRLWSTHDARHEQFYRSYLGLGENESPTGIDNMKFFWGYQVNWMWWRYFMWNYVGRQNNYQGQGEAKNGNWVSGIPFIDKAFGRGDVDLLPDDYANNQARNHFYFLPFILGIIGLLYHWKRDKEDTIVIFLLFLFTGFATVVYLNNTPLQPRERDYAFAGATYAFAVWIGLGVLALSNGLRKGIKGVGAPAIATLLCLVLVPGIMAKEGWDDHDRSKNTLARDHAYNILSSLDQNAILITNGDNDTYPLWYLQEVEGFRRDVRIVNANLLGMAWANDQMTYKVNDADPVPVIWKQEDYIDGEMNYILYNKHPQLKENSFYDLKEIIEFFSNDKNRLPTQGGGRKAYFPTKNFSVPVDKNAVLSSGWVDESLEEYIPERIKFTFDKSSMSRADMAILNIVAGQAETGWNRPIYIVANNDRYGLDDYFYRVGAVEKLVPIEKNQMTAQGKVPQYLIDQNADLMLNVYQYGNANENKAHFDDKHKYVIMGYRNQVGELGMDLALAGKKDKAIEVLDDFMNRVSKENLPYAVSMYDHSFIKIISAYLLAEDLEKAKKYSEALLYNGQKEFKYFQSLKPKMKGGTNAYFAQVYIQSLMEVINMWKRHDAKYADDFEKELMNSVPVELLNG